MAIYKDGTIKLTWVNDSDYSVLESSMHDSLQSAIDASKNRKNWLIFQLISSEGDNYKWKLLPYGRYRSYTTGMSLSNSFLFKASVFTVICFAAYGIYGIYSQSHFIKK